MAIGRTEFLERENYRQRRFRDGARMLPLLAVVLMMLPLLWPRETAEQSLTSSGIIYLFGLWFVLIVLAFLFSRLLRVEPSEAKDEDEGGGS